MNDRVADPDAAISFVLRVGRALHTYGYPAHRLEDVMAGSAARLGLPDAAFRAILMFSGLVAGLSMANIVLPTRQGES